MQIMTGVFVIAAVVIGAMQIGSSGLHAFLDRPPGVKATPDDDDPTSQPAPTTRGASPAPDDGSAPAAPRRPDDPHRGSRPEACRPPLRQRSERGHDEGFGPRQSGADGRACFRPDHG